jgi:hypothetical protein
VTLGVQDRAQVGVAFAQRAVDVSFVQRHLDCGVQVAGRKRFHQITVGFDLFGSLQGGRIGIRGQEHDRRFADLADPLGGFDPVHRTFEPHIHQDQIGLCPAGRVARFRAGSDHIHDAIPQSLQMAFEIEGNELFVLDNQDCGSSQHLLTPSGRRVRMVTNFHRSWILSNMV